MKKILKKQNIKYYLIYYAIIEFLFNGSFIKGVLLYVYNFFKVALKSPNFESFIKAFAVLIVMLSLWGVIFVILTLPLTIYLLAKKTADNTREIENKKYNSSKDFKYYREKLNGISPTTISLMKNLKIEEDKDLTATIMKLQINKNISIQNNNIKILSEDVSNLTISEKRLFYMLLDNNVNKKQIERWKEISLEEAKEQGYIKDKSSTSGITIKKIILILVLILFILGFTYFQNSFDVLMNELENIGISEDLQVFEIVNNENFDFLFNILIQGSICAICAVGIIAWPIFYIVYLVRYQKKDSALKRTEKGDKLTDIVLGLKNFIHDFSMLNQADKEAVVLWDEFLVYAIVLEENKQIIDEITSLKEIENFDTRVIIQKD